MTIDYSYFNGLINIPNADKAEVQQKINTLVADIQPHILSNLLGYELYKAYLTDTALASPSQRFIDLRDGAEFTYCGRLYKWKGLFRAVGNKKYSLIANYIFFHYINNHITITTGVGEAKSNIDNASWADSNNKAILAYNMFVNEAQELYLFLEAKYAVYPEWNYTYSVEAKRQINSLGI